jgi:hypothetical protein
LSVDQSSFSRAQSQFATITVSLDPLSVFFRGKYHRLSPQNASEPMWPLPIHY